MKINKFLFGTFLCAAIASSLQFSCDKVKEKLSVKVGMNVTEITFDIPAFPEVGELKESAIVNYNINLDSLIKSENDKLGIKNIHSVKINSCQLTLLNPGEEKSFGDLESCKLELAAGNSDNWTTVAEVSNNPTTKTYSLNLPVNTDANLKDFFTSNQFKYRIGAANRNPITSPSQIKAAISYTLQVGL